MFCGNPYGNGATTQQFDDNWWRKSVAPEFNMRPNISRIRQYWPKWQRKYILAKGQQGGTVEWMASSINIVNGYTAYRDDLIRMLRPLKSMSEGNTGQTSAATNKIEWCPPLTRPIHSVPNQAVPKAEDFEEIEVDNLLSINVVEPAHTDWASLIVFDPRKDGTIDMQRYDGAYGFPRRQASPVLKEIIGVSRWPPKLKQNQKR